MRLSTAPLYNGFCLEFEKKSKGARINHAHFGIEFHVCEIGDGYIRSGQIEKPLFSGCVSLIYGPAFHSVTSNPDKDYFRTVMHVPQWMVYRVASFINVKTRDWLPSKTSPLKQVVPLSKDKLYLKRSLRKINWELRNVRDVLTPTVLIYLAEIMDLLYNVSKDSKVLRDKVAPSERRLIDQALIIIEESNSPVLFAKELAIHLGVSSGHLRRTFNKVLGKSPSEFLLDRRMEIGKNHLLDGVSVSRVATICGYADASSFGRAFKSHFGTSPLEFLRLRGSSSRQK